MALIIDIKVIPQSGKQLFKLDKAGRLTCYLKNAPERGLANKELIKLLSKGLKIPQTEVEIIGGKTSRNKRMKIAKDIDRDTLLEQLGIQQQMNIFDS